jgi:Cytochrome b5-like Heme/Steroid binding domain
MIARGDKLVILDDMVLDVINFRWEHPGGQFLIDFHIGHDISKYFYGGYVLEHSTGMKPTNHSNVARSIVNGLIIGKLCKVSHTFEGQIIHCTDVNSNTKVLTMKCDEVIVSGDVDDFGKHFLIRSLNNRSIQR